jgi:lactoylglutathione lyase
LPVPAQKGGISATLERKRHGLIGAMHAQPVFCAAHHRAILRSTLTAVVRLAEPSADRAFDRLETLSMKYLHTMIRISDIEESLAFFHLLGLKEVRRAEHREGRFTLIFLAAPGDEEAQVELTYNWDPEEYTGGRNFGHLAYQVDDIYETCERLMQGGVTINRPPRDGRMAFVRTPDGISIELIQKGQALHPEEPWTSMSNVGKW